MSSYAQWVSQAAAVLLMVGLTSSACSDSRPSVSPPPKAVEGSEPARAVATPGDEAAAAPDRASFEEISFALRATSSTEYAVGESAAFSVALEGRGPWHINQDYPIAVEVHASDGLELTKGRFERKDAAEFSDRKARFDVPFKATQSGKIPVKASVSFAVCTDDKCQPEERTLALRLHVVASGSGGAEQP